MTQELPFFVRDGDRYLPTAASRGFWSPQSLNGRVIVGLLGYELERLYGEPGWQPARLTVDMFRLPDHSPVEFVTRVIRDGRRLRLMEADFISGGVPMGRASCQFLKRTDPPPGEFWRPEPWDAPPPLSVPLPEDAERRAWDLRPFNSRLDTIGPRRAWLRELRELVGGVPLTPFTRVAVAADLASPFANRGSQGVGYINSDVTVYLHRLPATEWIGFELANHQATEGVATGTCWLHDEQGPIGSASVAAVAQTRRPDAGPANAPV